MGLTADNITGTNPLSSGSRATYAKEVVKPNNEVDKARSDGWYKTTSEVLPAGQGWMFR
jgi:hypothetical protein